MTQIGLLVEAGIDFLEVSGGTYEDPKVSTSIPVTSKIVLNII